MDMVPLTVAFYVGPPRKDWQHTLSHYAIRLWTLSHASHAELVLPDGTCWSSSARDGGVRQKKIDLSTGRWVCRTRMVPASQALFAEAWFNFNEGSRYDWAGVARFVIPLLPHSPDRFFCFEAIGRALDLPAAHKFTANDLWSWFDS